MRKSILVGVIVLLGVANITSAEIIRGIDMDFVTIGNAGNPGDTRTETYLYGNPIVNPYGCGAVGYEYKIGKYEVTNAQWSAFITLSDGAPTGNPSNAYDNIADLWTGANVPTNEVSWLEAAQFCNYLTSGDKSQGAYLFSGNNTNPGDFLGIDRGSALSAYGIAYVIPTEDEWYKAAYYSGSGYSTYANGTDVAPIAGVDTNYAQTSPYDGLWDVGTGTMEQNGTFDIMGNVWEWNELLIDSFRGVRSGSYGHYGEHGGAYGLSSSYRYYGLGQHFEEDDLGFRVASVPEPATLLLLALGAVMVRKKR